MPWQMKLIYEFGAQKSGEQPDSSSQPRGGVDGDGRFPPVLLLFLTLCHWHAIDCRVPLTQR